MNKKGQSAVIGGLIMLAIAIIVGAVLLQSSAQNIESVVNIQRLDNHSLTTVVNGTAQYITGFKAITGATVYNQTANIPIGAGNYTITNHVVYNGQEAIKIVPATSANYKNAWLISGDVEPLAYSDGSTRSITNLIIILMALALAVVAISYGIKSYNE